MKLPHRPTKPYAPYKPTPPAKEVERTTTIGSVSFEADSGYTLKSFEDFIKSNISNADPAEVKFSWEIHKEPTYYDETIISLQLNFSTNALVPNNNYDKMYEVYLQQLARYKKDYSKFKEDCKKYNADMIKFEEDYDVYMLERNKKAVEALSKKIAAKGKKK